MDVHLGLQVQVEALLANWIDLRLEGNRDTVQPSHDVWHTSLQSGKRYGLSVPVGQLCFGSTIHELFRVVVSSINAVV